MASEAKWWPKGVVPRFGGVYVGHRSEIPHKFVTVMPENFPGAVFYGPLPEVPKELPMGRRFKAKHANLGDVSGVYVRERSPNLLAYHVMYWERDLLRDCWTEIEYLSDIQWLDKE